MIFKTSEKIRKYKKEYMKKRRADPIISQRIRLVTRKWYASSGRKQRQREYLEKMKVERFFHWRARLFNMHYGTKLYAKNMKMIDEADVF